MTNVTLNKTKIEGTIKVGFNDRGLRLLSFKQFGIAEEGLALVFKPKDATEKSLQRIRGLVRDFESTRKEFMENPKKTELVERMEHLMKKLCGKIGQMEKLANSQGNSYETVLARKALHLIEEHCGVAMFQQRAERIMEQSKTNQSGRLFC